MDYKLIFENFKKQFMQADGYFPVSLFPVLFIEFRKYGATQSIMSEEFVQDFLNVFFPNDKPKAKLMAIQCITFYTKEFLPQVNNVVNTKKEVKEVVETKQVDEPSPTPVSTKVNPNPEPKQAKLEDIPRINYNEPIPDEVDEDDPLYTPPDQILHIKPEDCAPTQYDWDWIEKIGAVGYKK